MLDLDKTKQQVVAERDALHARLAEMEQAEADRVQAEKILRLTQFFVDHAAEPSFWIGRDGGYLYANQAACRSLGYEQRELLAMSVLDVDVDVTPESWPEHWQRVKQRGAMTFESRHRRKTGEIFPVEITANHLEFDDNEYHCSFARDITERKSSQRQAGHLNSVLRALRQIDQAVRGETDRARVLRRACETLVEAGAYQTAWIALIGTDGTARDIGFAGMGREFEPVSRRLRRGELSGCMMQALASPEVQVIEAPHLSCPDCPLAGVYGGGGAMCVRLPGNGRALGLLGVSVAPDLIAGPNEQELFEEVAADLAATFREADALDQQRRIEQELQVARRGEAVIGFKIQQMLLLGRVPEDVPGLAVSAVSVPSEYIDGDFYDFFRHSDQCLDVIVGDVMGKGIPAALLGAATKSHTQKAISALASAGDGNGPPEPRRIVRRLHEQITRQLINLESFVTLCYARIDLRKARLELVDCGHTRTIHYRPHTDRCRLLHGENFFLGVMEECEYTQLSVPLAEGDVLLFYSDGVVEARRADGEFFGTGRLTDLVRRFGRLGPDRLIDEVRHAVVAFSGSDSFADDLTCVGVQIRQLAAEPVARRVARTSSSPEELAPIREFVGSVCTDLAGGKMDQAGAACLQVAVNEAVNNITRHAYGGRTDEPIELEGLVFDDRVTIRLRHWGRPVDEDQPIPEGPAPRGEDGFGLYIIHRAVDDVAYGREADGGGWIRLTRMFRAEGAGRELDGSTD